jgi:hypothetical protein
MANIFDVDFGRRSRPKSTSKIFFRYLILARHVGPVETALMSYSKDILAAPAAIAAGAIPGCPFFMGENPSYFSAFFLPK